MVDLKFKKHKPVVSWVEEELLFLKNVIVDRQDPIYYVYWIHNGITKVKHIWCGQHSRFYTVTELLSMYPILGTNIQSFTNQYTRLKNPVPNEYCVALKRRHRTCDLTLENVFNLPLSVKGVITKQLYILLLETSSDPIRIAKICVFNRFKGENECYAFWKCLYGSALDFKIKEFMWRKAHHGLATRPMLFEWHLTTEKSASFVTITRIDYSFIHPV